MQNGWIMVHTLVGIYGSIIGVQMRQLELWKDLVNHMKMENYEQAIGIPILARNLTLDEVQI